MHAHDRLIDLAQCGVNAQQAPTIFPSTSLIGDAISETLTRRPSFARLSVSI